MAGRVLAILITLQLATLAVAGLALLRLQALEAKVVDDQRSVRVERELLTVQNDLGELSGHLDAVSEQIGEVSDSGASLRAELLGDERLFTSDYGRLGEVDGHVGQVLDRLNRVDGDLADVADDLESLSLKLDDVCNILARYTACP